ncbi:hypothetical protein T4B_11816 [Trichinella pseudospiralis]|uniref:Uncharacterized protein n=1 Tax=Trichinella pseudospiralis TaxID=6337 RepID=A0A0V1I763_TRIPS|nr:hypothetical protein T4B_11816 [Trichinella pseudospiralis]
MTHFSYTSNQMVYNNFGNVPDNRNYQSNQVGNPMVNKDVGRVNGRFNFITAGQMENRNLMPTSSNYYNTNTYGANTYTNYKMPNANSGNAAATEIYQYCQGINRGDPLMSTKSNILQPSKIQETNLMEHSLRWNGNKAACGETYATYKMGNSTDSNAVVNENYGLRMNWDANYASNVCSAMNSSTKLSSPIENINAPLQSYENCETFSRVPYQELSSNDGWIAATGAPSNVMPNNVFLISNDANYYVNQDETQNTNEFANLNYDCFVNDDTSQIQFQNAVSPNIGFAGSEIEYGQLVSSEYPMGQVVGDSYAMNANMYQENCYANTEDVLQNGNGCVQYGDGTLNYAANFYLEDKQIEWQASATVLNHFDESDESWNYLIYECLPFDTVNMQFVDWILNGNELINVYRLDLSCYCVIEDHESSSIFAIDL